MKRIKLQLALAITLGFFGATVANAQTYYYLTGQNAGPYFRADAGPSFFQSGQLNQFGGPSTAAVQYDTGLSATLAGGYAFDPYFSLDFDTGYTGARLHSVSGYYISRNTSLSNVPLMFNGRLSYPIAHSNVVPYVGAGLGPSISVFRTDNMSDATDTVSGSESDAVFAWQAFAGLRFMINPAMSLGLGYRYFATESSSFSYPSYPYGPNFDVGFKGVRTHSVLFTFEWDF